MKDKKKGYIYILLTTVIFSTMEVALKMVAGVFAPMQITVQRFFIGGLCILPFAAWVLRRKGLRLAPRDFWYMAFTGLLCVPTSMVLYQLAVSNTLASVVAVVFSGNPIFVVPLAGLLYHEVIYKNHWAALVFIVAGILAIADPWHNQLSPTGVILSVLAAIVFSFYLLLSSPITRKYGGLVTTCGSFLFGSLELYLLMALSAWGPAAAFYRSIGLGLFCNVPLWKGVNASTLPYFLYICVVNSALGFVCHQMALLHTDAKTVGLVFFFKPALAPLLAYLALGEVAKSNMLVGIAFFLAGSLVSLVPDMLRERRPETEACNPVEDTVESED